jgi:hypothetical protein
MEQIAIFHQNDVKQQKNGDKAILKKTICNNLLRLFDILLSELATI